VGDGISLVAERQDRVAREFDAGGDAGGVVDLRGPVVLVGHRGGDPQMARDDLGTVGGARLRRVVGEVLGVLDGCLLLGQFPQPGFGLPPVPDRAAPAVVRRWSRSLRTGAVPGRGHFEAEL